MHLIKEISLKIINVHKLTISNENENIDDDVVVGKNVVCCCCFVLAAFAIFEIFKITHGMCSGRFVKSSA